MVRIIYVLESNQYDPMSFEVSTESCPVREVGSIWDVAVLARFLQRHELDNHIEEWINHYLSFLIGCCGPKVNSGRKLLRLDSKKLHVCDNIDPIMACRLISELLTHIITSCSSLRNRAISRIMHS